MKKEQVKHEKNTLAPTSKEKETQEQALQALRVAKFRKMIKKGGLCC